MERALLLSDRDALRRGRKRRLDQQRAASEPDTASSTEAAPLPEQPVELVFDPLLQQRVKDSVQQLAEQQYANLFSGRYSSSFAARTTVGVWLATQAVAPVPFGMDWAALAYVCFFLLVGAYSNGPQSFEHQEMLQVDHFTAMLTQMGRTNSTTTMSEPESRLMMAARQWSRVSRGEMQKTLFNVFNRMSSDKRVRLAVEGALFNARSASSLFK